MLSSDNTFFYYRTNFILNVGRLQSLNSIGSTWNHQELDGQTRNKGNERHLCKLWGRNPSLPSC